MKGTTPLMLTLLLLLHLPPVCVAENLRTPQYFYCGFSQTWWSARSYCRQHHTDLVTISGQADNAQAVRVHGWIGLHRGWGDPVWRWSRGNQRANFTSWEPSHPQDHEHCAFKYQGQTVWESDQCNTLHTFTCWNERLILVKENKTWEEALEHCRTMEDQDPMDPMAYNSHRYNLATLVTADDHHYAQEKIQEATTDTVWTGLRFLAGQWRWVGGEAAQFEGDCPPDGRGCGVLQKKGPPHLQTEECTHKLNFLCYRRTPTSPDSTCS